MVTPKGVPRRLLLAGAIGSILEWYDFSIFGAFTVVLARVFFPSSDQVTAVLATFAVFGVGFLARPLGAIIFGLVLYLWRVLVQDKSKILWRDPHNEPGDLG